MKKEMLLLSSGYPSDDSMVIWHEYVNKICHPLIYIGIESEILP